MSEPLSLYNPRDTPPEQLEAMLTGREPLLREILDSLREQVDAPTRQHWLLRGPRGIGKTHLTGVIHHRIQNDPVLSKAYLPLWLGEADVYEVYSPATLLLRIGERLGEALPQTGLIQRLNALEGGGDEDLLFEELTDLLSEEAERQERVLIVLMENLDALFESFAPKQRTEQTRQLRALLLGNPRFLFISTTPTRYLKELSDPKAPLFAQLKERKLSPLKVKEVGALFTKLTQLTGRKELLGQGTDASLKQRIIHQLTGGLPRSVVMAFEVLRDKEGIQVLVEDLRAFLDAQTAYFEARLSRLAPRERAIVTTFALADQNLTLKELSEKSRLPEKSLSTLVARLQQEGHVEAMDGSGGKGTLYGLSEGLFRIWYQYRKGRLLLEPLVRFLAYWYEPEELQGVVNTMKQRPQQGLGVGRAVKLALLQVEAAFQLATSEHGRLERQRLWEECRKAVEDSVSDASEKLSPAFEEELLRGFSLLLEGREREGLVLLDETLKRHGPLSANGNLLVIQTLLRAGLSVDEEKAEISGHPELLSWALDRYKESPDKVTVGLVRLFQLSFAEMLRKRGRVQDALLQAEDLLGWLPSHSVSRSSPALIGAERSRAMSLFTLGRHEEARVVFEEQLAHVQPDEHRLVKEVVPINLCMLAKIHRQAERPREEKAILERMMALPADSLVTVSVRLMVAVEKFRFICLEFSKAEPDMAKAHRDIETWFTEHQGLLSKLAPQQLRGFECLRRLSRASLDDVSGDDLPADLIRELSEWLIDIAPLEVAEFFLEYAEEFVHSLPRESRTWIERLLVTAISESHKQQLRMYHQLLLTMESVSDEQSGSPEGVQQALGRVTVEYRQLFKALISKMS